MSAPPESSAPKSRPPGGNFGKFAGLGVQMLATIGLCTWLGLWLDGRYHLSPWGTVVLTLLGVFAAMYQVIRAVQE